MTADVGVSASKVAAAATHGLVVPASLGEHAARRFHLSSCPTGPPDRIQLSLPLSRLEQAAL